MISRRSSRIVARDRSRSKRGRALLHVEALEARSLLSADGLVAVEIVEPTDLDMTYPVGAEECFMSGEMMFAMCGFVEIEAPEIETSEMAVSIESHFDMGEKSDVSEAASETTEAFDVPVESGEVVDFGAIDSSELMFFSMALGGEEFLPDDAAATCDGILLDEEIPGDEEVIEGYDDAVIDPVIFANVSGSSDDASEFDVDPTVADPESVELAFEMVPAAEVAETLPILPESTTPPPTTPTPRAFATFGQSPNSFAASLAAAFAGLGSDRSASGDDDLLGGRRRGRR